MRILLQHVRTQLYLTGEARWTDNHFDALDFRHSQNAMDFIYDHAIADAQIVVKFADSEFDEIVPLPGRTGPMDSRRIQP